MSRPKVADPFDVARRLLDRWRGGRRPRGRMPEQLWRVALDLARQHGPARTATALDLNPSVLARHLAGSAAAVGNGAPRPAGFVELPLALAVADECSVDIQDRCGATLSVRLKGRAIGQVEAVLRSAWSRRPR